MGQGWGHRGAELLSSALGAAWAALGRHRFTHHAEVPHPCR